MRTILRKLARFTRRHPTVMMLSGVVVVGAAIVGWRAYSFFDVPRVQVDFAIPQAPRLVADGPDQTVYRIDASRSSVTYEVTEHLAAIDRTARGVTQGIAGDILVDDAEPSRSRLGEIVVNIEQFTSDERLRDDRIRHDYLESHRYPLARFRPTDVEGLPGEIVDGREYELRVTGDLTVKETTKPVVLDATVRRDGDELHVHATTTVKLSDFDVGPIRVIGFVSTGDDARLVFELVAVDEAELRLPEQVAAGEDTPVADGDGPSFAEAVEPILEQRCASCHAPDGPGASTWTLATAGDAAEVASGLALTVESGYMPPWPASDVGVPLRDALRMDDDEIETILAWADAGGPLDVDPEQPIDPSPRDGIPEVRRDVVLPLPEPYTPPAEVEDEYRCFVLDPGLEEPAVVTGYEFVPDATDIVHHALVYRLTGDATDGLDEQDARDPGPGWQCFGGVGVEGRGLSASGRDGGVELTLGWAPGLLPAVLPDGAGLRLEPGDVFVTQIHYHTEEDPSPDRSTLALQLGDDDPASYDEVVVTTYLAPAEIPCGPDESGPLCERDAVIAEIGEKYGPVGPTIANGLHLLCDTSVEELAVLDEHGLAHTSCDHDVRNTGEILAVLGHMHEIGKSFRMTLNPGTPDELVLLDIPQWDFEWQYNYRPVDRIALEPGDVIHIECSWDRSLLDPGDPPRYVTWSEGTNDEMCFSTVTTRERAADAGSENG